MEENNAPENAFSALNGDTKGVHFRYQRTVEPSRQTTWREKKKKDALKAAASGSADIRGMFARQPPISQPSLEISRLDIVNSAILDLEKRLGLRRTSQSSINSINAQTKTRYRAVLHFLYAQRKYKTSTRRELSLSIANSFNRGKYFSESLITWE